MVIRCIRMIYNNPFKKITSIHTISKHHFASPANFASFTFTRNRAERNIFFKVCRPYALPVTRFTPCERNRCFIAVLDSWCSVCSCFK